MSFLENLSEFGVGATQGVNQGMDLYQKYQTIQDENAKRQKTQMFEAKAKELTQSGGFDDPVKGIQTLADYALELGDPDMYLKYNETAKGLRKTKADREGMNAYQSAMSGDYGTAFQSLNQLAQTLNTGKNYDLQRTPTGYRAVSMLNGKRNEIDLATDEEVQSFLMAETEPYLFDDVGKYMEAKREGEETEAEIAKSASATELARAQTLTEEARRPGEVAALGAQVGAYGAQAASSAATARQTEAETAALPVKQELERRQGEADIAYKSALTGSVGQTPDPGISVIVDRTTTVDPLAMEGPPATKDKAIRTNVAAGIKQLNGVNDETAVAMGDAVLNSPTWNIDVKTGTFYMGDGTPIKMSPAAIAAFLQARPPGS